MGKMGVVSLPDDLKRTIRQGFDSSLEDNVNAFKLETGKPRDVLADQAAGVRAGSLNGISDFQLSVRLLGVLKELENEEGTDPDFEGHVTAVLTSELLILKLNFGIPLKYNPFLSHWVLTTAVLQQFVEERSTDDIRKFIYGKVRLGILQMALTLLNAEDGKTAGNYEKTLQNSPRFIIEDVQRKDVELLDISPFLETMRKQGLELPKVIADRFPILDSQQQVSNTEAARNPIGATGVAHSYNQVADVAEVLNDYGNVLSQDHPQPIGPLEQRELLTSGQSSSNPSRNLEDEISAFTLEPVDSAQDGFSSPVNKGKLPALPITPITPQSSPDTIQRALEADLEGTTHTIMRFPLDLQSLDLLTKLLESDMFTKTGADASMITREYVQHCLRLIEHRGFSYSPTSEFGTFDQSFSVLDGTPSGREEQARAVQLLVLFMKNLLRKGLLPVQELALDIDGFCLSFIWVPEVREFRKFLDGSSLLDVAPAVPPSAFGVGG